MLSPFLITQHAFPSISQYLHRNMRNQEFIKSYIRLKPALPAEIPALAYSRREVTVKKTKEIFSFNEVFGDEADNEYVYSTAVQPIIDDVLSGYSACVLAYGQTFSGKTYLMRGGKNSLGLIPLCIKEIFRRIEERGLTAKVSISYFEIYNENIIDLLGSIEENKYLELREDNKKNLVIVNLNELTVTNEYDALQYYENGEQMRKSANNTINISSSRSHTIFKVTLSMVEEGGRLIEGGIYMVDLAGSESIGKTNAVGQLKKEAENINKSLLALTSVIRSISQKDVHITYRNSKLTRILQPSLSGNSKTVVICTAKQTEDCISETINTLRFGVSASSIRTEARQHVVEAEYDRSSTEILENERAERAKLQRELMNRIEVIENLKLENGHLTAELDDSKHKLWSLQNDNRNKGGLIEHYQSLQGKQNNQRNLFANASEEVRERLERENRNLKASNNTLRQTLDAKEKQIATLEKNERTLLDKVQKYQAQLNNLQKLMDEAKRQQKKKVEFINNPASQVNKTKIEKSFQQQTNRNQYSSQTHISSPFTIGTVVELSTSMLAMKIDMSHYLTTIREMHVQIENLQKEIDTMRQQQAEPEEELGRRESVGSVGKKRDKAREREKEQLRYLRCQNAKLKRRNGKYIQMVQKTAQISDKSVIGYNEYLEKNFKYSEDELFAELFRENPDDYRPIKRYFPLRRKKYQPQKEPENDPSAE